MSELLASTRDIVLVAVGGDIGSPGRTVAQAVGSLTVGVTAALGGILLGRAVA